MAPKAKAATPEKKVDPATKKAMTYEELAAAYKGQYKKGEIKKFTPCLGD